MRLNPHGQPGVVRVLLCVAVSGRSRACVRNSRTSYGGSGSPERRHSTRLLKPPNGPHRDGRQPQMTGRQPIIVIRTELASVSLQPRQPIAEPAATPSCLPGEPIHQHGNQRPRHAKAQAGNPAGESGFQGQQVGLRGQVLPLGFNYADPLLDIMAVLTAPLLWGVSKSSPPAIRLAHVRAAQPFIHATPTTHPPHRPHISVGRRAPRSNQTRHFHDLRPTPVAPRPHRA